MRKLLVVLTSFVVLTPSITQVIACTPDHTLKIAFVPSINSVEVMNIVRPLEAKLEQEIHYFDPQWNHKVTIQTTTSYEAAGQALEDGKVGLAFLPVGTYTKYWGDQLSDGRHSDLAPLVVAERWAMKPDAIQDSTSLRNINFNQTRSILSSYYTQSQGITDKASAYDKLYTKNEPITFYRSEILANNNFLQNNNVDMKTLLEQDQTTYKTTMYNLAKKAIDDDKFNLIMSDTSGAGVIYPLAWLIDIGFSPYTTEGAYYIKKILNGTRVTSYSVGAQNISTDASEMTVGYTDIRADMPNDNAIKTAYANSSIVGITNGIYNDGISYSKSVIKDSNLLYAIREAFEKLIQDPANKKIFSVYQHTGYKIPDSDSVKVSNEWEANYDKEYQANMNEKTLIAVNYILQNY